MAGAAHCRLEGCEKGDFAAQAQGFVKVTRLRRGVESLLGWDLRCRVFAPKFAFCEKSRVKRSFWSFGSLDCHFWWKSLLVEVSCKTLILEAWRGKCEMLWCAVGVSRPRKSVKQSKIRASRKITLHCITLPYITLHYITLH